MLPSGEIWNETARVVNGQVVINLPDANIKYQIESIALPNAVTDVSDEENLPIEWKLEQNYPNPFNPSTTISYSLPKAGLVHIEVYNLLGQVVTSLVNEELPAGQHQIQFDASGLASGTYFYRLTCGSFSDIKKMLLMK
ncbi:T9SS type A sorting domain-containing protein [Candidatus Falkowbacteria bacterium]|uniref:Secretion system C-terminal sorting domain-containing protein n=1 Tax=Candidatus Falkowbacteria bacterium CG10_big_fil_rev_8_21_14_0_10_37_18 TaxID=1974562 RepID=A0A2H0VC15_9BACT|nr:T9SS type A sorting domain-containing protein [Candidatus Falkowbacteria bacterium]NCQ12961.1 T9SS type A sorting domain-containing protein [Candidatus Falkowbacteria bacterium]OIO06585.1 MAG: hypothetical protein AUJ26_00435 [Candidatus Falkowbacteria bacterium CG1_02_37_21]PIR95840.1 MAG: hypothetical protein COT93_00340 [Candidatus Falkowbacteria bacterium CG10_big_fil_rev_8_21_14_0_10_37_18]